MLTLTLLLSIAQAPEVVEQAPAPRYLGGTPSVALSVGAATPNFFGK